MKKKKSPIKVVLITLLCIIAAVVLIVGGYFVYVLLSFHRLPDVTELTVEQNRGETAKTDTEYSILSYNIGFGAYEADYSFFMDGGHESWAWSKERLDQNLKKIEGVLEEHDADFMFLQEVDIDATRSYHVDESKYFSEPLGSSYAYSFAQNYDSPFLMYPFYQPHGANKAGIMTFSKTKAENATRYALPIEDSLYKLLDLDRCYTVTRIPAENGKELVLINFHLSAYTSDGTIADEQVRIIVDFMESEYKKGNYVIAGGDFNKDLSGNATEFFGTLPIEDYTWAQPFPERYLEGTDLQLIFPYDPVLRVPSCRNPNEAWTNDNATQFVITIDGFLVSENVEVVSSEVVDLSFAYSDHNPVKMVFSLKGATD